MTSRVLNRGFTLIELALVTVTIGVLMVAAAPQVQRGWSSIRTEQAAFAIAQSLRAARVLAITNQRTSNWLWDREARQVCVGLPQTKRCAEVNPHDRLAKPRSVPPPIQLTVQPGNGQDVERISFFPNGTTSQTATLLVSDTDVPRHHIIVDGPTGVVQTRAGAPPSNP